METWQVIIAGILALLTTLGAGARWAWTRVETMQDRYLTAQRESEERWLERDRELQARVDTERDARLADRTEHAREMREMLELWTSELRRLRTRNTSPPSALQSP